MSREVVAFRLRGLDDADCCRRAEAAVGAGSPRLRRGEADGCLAVPPAVAGIACTVCGGPVSSVRAVTVRSLAHPAALARLAKGDGAGTFYLCLSPVCPAVYLDGRGGWISRDEVAVRVWYKEGPPPTPACYCKGVSQEEIWEHVAGRGCCRDLDDVKAHTGARTGKECVTRNPSGRCCGPVVEAVIERALAASNGGAGGVEGGGAALEAGGTGRVRAVGAARGREEEVRP